MLLFCLAMSDDDDIINIDTTLPTIRRCEVPSDYKEPVPDYTEPVPDYTAPEDGIEVTSRKRSMSEHGAARRDRSMPEHVAVRRDSATEITSYSPKKRRLLQHINTEYNGKSETNGGEEGFTPSTDILSPRYNQEPSSPLQGLLSPMITGESS